MEFLRACFKWLYDCTFTLTLVLPHSKLVLRLSIFHCPLTTSTSHCPNTVSTSQYLVATAHCLSALKSLSLLTSLCGPSSVVRIRLLPPRSCTTSAHHYNTCPLRRSLQHTPWVARLCKNGCWAAVTWLYILTRSVTSRPPNHEASGWS